MCNFSFSGQISLAKCLKSRHVLSVVILALGLSPLPTAVAADTPPQKTGSKTAPKFTKDQLEAMHSVFLDYYVQLLDTIQNTDDFNNVFLGHLNPTDRKDVVEMLKAMGEPPLVTREGNDLVFTKGNESIRMQWAHFDEPKFKINGIDWLIDPKRPLQTQLNLLNRRLELLKKSKSESALQQILFPFAKASGYTFSDVAVTYGSSAFASIEKAVVKEAAAASAKVTEADLAKATAKADAKAERSKMAWGIGLGAAIGKPLGDTVGGLWGGTHKYACLQFYDNGFDPNGWMMIGCDGVNPPDDPNAVVGNSYSDLAAQSEKSKSVLGLFTEPMELQCPKLHASVYRAKMRDVAVSPTGDPLPADKNTNPWFFVRVNYLDDKKGIMDSICVQKDHEDAKCSEDENLLYYIKIRSDKKVGYMTIPEEVADNQKRIAATSGDKDDDDTVANAKLDSLKTTHVPRQTDDKDQTSEPSKLRYVPVKPSNKMTTDEELAFHKGLDIIRFINARVMTCKAKEAAQATEEGRKVPSPDSAPNAVEPNAPKPASLVK